MSVLDASVILKWFVEEEGSDRALEIRRDFVQGKSEIAVPDLLLYEMANVLSLHPGFTVKEIDDSLGSIWDIGLSIVTPTKSLMERAVGLSRHYNLTAYDASYLALADELGFDFITADSKLCRKVKAKASGRLKARIVLL